MHVLNLVQAQTLLQFTLAEYSAVRSTYWAQIYDLVEGYLTSSDRVTAYKSEMKRAMLETFTRAGDIAWEDGGGTPPLDQDAASWLTSRMNAEMGFIDNLFETLKMLRQEEAGNISDAAISKAFATADGYSKTLDAVYSQTKVLAAGSKMLTFVGEDGDESCEDCRKHKSKRHRASWWVAHDAVPPNRNFECKGYRCQHVLVDDQGRLFTI